MTPDFDDDYIFFTNLLWNRMKLGFVHTTPDYKPDNWARGEIEEGLHIISSLYDAICGLKLEAELIERHGGELQ